MPHACSTWTPYFSWNSLIIAGGQADPPITVRLIVEKRRLFVSVYASNPCHTVGTPAETVTFSASSNSYKDLPPSAAPCIISFAPPIGAAYGRPHALTWNIGTTGSNESRAERFSASGSAIAKLCSSVERWLYSAPFGLPVVPEV